MDMLIAYRILFLGIAAFVVFLAIRDTRKGRVSMVPAAEPTPFEEASEPAAEAPAAFRPGSYFRRAESVLKPWTDPRVAERLRVLQDLLREGAISQQEHDAIIGRVLKQA